MKNIIKKFLIGSLLAIGFIASGILSKPVEAAVGDTIAQTFPDPKLAQAVASRYTGGDVNAILIQPLVDSIDFIPASNKGITDLTGIGTLTALESL